MKIKVYSLADVYWILNACLGICSGQNDLAAIGADAVRGTTACFSRLDSSPQ